MTALYGFPLREVRRRTEQALEEVGMAELASRRLAGASHGMRQRIKLAQALVNDPPILLLDEPLLGVDPGGRRAINDLLLKLAARGKTILVSSHILVEIEQLANTILMIARGRLIASGTLHEVRSQLEDRPLVVEIVSSEARRLASLLVGFVEVQSVELADDQLLVRTSHPARFFTSLNELVLHEELDIQRMQTLDAGADAVFGYLEQGSA
jgi:ABC-2 type transport system ATP-binding protein